MDEDLRRAEFAEIGLKHGTDKVHHHRYDRFYPRYLKELGKIKTDFGMVEIGIDRSKSLSMWLEYFPSSHVYGMDIGAEMKGERHCIFKGDQSKLEDLVNFKRFISAFHHKIYFINDDGSHVPEHQVNTFNYLFLHLLEPGGIYIIEDVETSYWKKGDLYGYGISYGYRHPKSIVEIFKALVDDLNKEFLSPHNRKIHTLVHTSVDDDTKNMISTITFGSNCIIITKKTKDEMMIPDRSYRFAEFV